MGAIASLGSTRVAVVPGSQASLVIKVRNSGSVVDQMTISVVGEAAAWSTPEPATLSLFPGAEETATITFSPPRSASVAAGEMPFGVRVASQEDPAGSVVEEGRLDIAAFTEVGAELQPLTSRGSRGARHDLAVDNRGNTTLNANIVGFDSSEEMAFDIRPPSIVADPGTAAFAQVDVRPRDRFWRGQPKSRAFSVQVEAAGQAPIPVSGTFLQEPLLPGWLLKGLAALAAAAIALLAFWFLILQPQLLTAAEERAEEVAQQTTEQALDDAGITPGGGGNGGGNDETPAPDATATPVPATPAPAVAQTPRHARLRVGSQIRLPSGGASLYLTDLVFSNPLPQEGEITLRRNDDDDLLVLRLENFRDLDFHFVTPIVIGPGDTLSLRCTEGSCQDAAVLYSGYEG